MKHIILFFLFLLLSRASPAQENPAILDFQISQVATGARLNFTLAAGNTCLGIHILRSHDNASFSEIGFIGGVCGSASADVSYTFTDSAPLVNKVGYYQLDLELLGTSNVHTFRYIRYGSAGVVAIPNISDGLFNLYFQNPLMEPLTLSVYDITGRKVTEMSYPNGDSIALNLSNEGSGEFIYIINISGIDRHNGKLIVY